PQTAEAKDPSRHHQPLPPIRLKPHVRITYPNKAPYILCTPHSSPIFQTRQPSRRKECDTNLSSRMQNPGTGSAGSHKIRSKPLNPASGCPRPEARVISATLRLTFPR